MTKIRNNKVGVFSTIEALNVAAAQLCIDIAQKSVLESGRFILCLSGGNTPRGLYRLLSMTPYRDLISWKDTFVFWGDERCVPADDEANNAHMANEMLLSKIVVPPSHIFPIPVNLPPADAAWQYELTLRNFFGTDQPRFDLLLLGLGENGHTASLFPGTAALHEKSRWVKEVFIEDQQLYRITMTATLLNMANHILFMVAGAEKSAVLNRVVTGSLHPDKYPVQLISAEHGEVLWYADQQAAGRLPDERVSIME